MVAYQGLEKCVLPTEVCTQSWYNVSTLAHPPYGAPLQDYYGIKALTIYEPTFHPICVCFSVECEEVGTVQL